MLVHILHFMAIFTSTAGLQQLNLTGTGLGLGGRAARGFLGAEAPLPFLAWLLPLPLPVLDALLW